MLLFTKFHVQSHGLTMVCDYLFCGTCFLNFRLSDITLFIEHKKSDCVANTHGCGRPSPNNLVANLLECVQCFRKFPTAWPLLMHVQVEHQLLFANAFRQASITARDDAARFPLTMNPSEPLLDRNQAPYEPVLDEPRLPSSTSETLDQSLPVTSCASNLCTIGTQTNISWFRTQSRVVRKRALCCASPLETDGVCAPPDSNNHAESCTTVSSELCHCSQIQTSNAMCPCQCCFSRSDLKATACPSSCVSKSNLLPTEFPDARVDCCAVRPLDDDTLRTDLIRPVCCLTRDGVSSDCCQGNLAPPSSQSVTVSCCPCPPVVKRSSMRSSEAQTDFDPEFSSPDYADIAMLLATPDRDAIYQPEMESLTTTINTTTWSQSLQEPSLESNTVQQLLPTSMMNEDGFSTADQSGGVPLLSHDSCTACIVQPKRVDWISSTNEVPQITSDTVIALEQPVYSTRPSATPPISHEALLTRSVTHQFVCSECGNTYRQKVHLRKHIMTQHTGQKPYRCPNCTYTTVEKSHLTVHVRTHTGERPFVCRECDYASAQNCTLKAHYIRKHLNSRIHCSKCGEPFYTELEQTNHERLCLGSRTYPGSSSHGSIEPIATNVKASGSPSRDSNTMN